MLQKLVAVTQSNYIPWRGYFDTINRCEHVVFLDDVQYTKRDWRNRNQIKTPLCKTWLSVPVKTKGKFASMRICEAEVSDKSWAEQHLAKFRQNYCKAPRFDTFFPQLEEVYGLVSGFNKLTDINITLMRFMCDKLEITTEFSMSYDHYSFEELDGFSTTERIFKLCQKVDATKYISGPAAKDYMELDLFEDAGIEVIWADYSTLKPYDQLYGEFDAAVSIVDYLMMV